MKISVLFAIAVVAFAFAAEKADEKVLYFDDFESRHELPVQPKSFNQPYTIEEWGFKKEDNNTFYRVAVTGKHWMGVCIAPRTNDTPKIGWGSFGKGTQGQFFHTPIDIPFDREKGYILSVKIRTDETCTPHTPMCVNVEFLCDSPSGRQRSEGRLKQEIGVNTHGEWVTVSQELTGSMIELLDAKGLGTRNLTIGNIEIGTFRSVPGPIVFEFDDVKIMEVPKSRIAAEAKKLNARPDLDGFSFTHKTNDDIFAWGAYGGDTSFSIPRWYYDSKDRKGIGAAVRIENELSPFTMMQMKRSFFNAYIRGGGLIFPSNGQPERDRIKKLLDLGQRYNLMIAPSTYLTRHYHSKLPMDECIRRIGLLKETIGEHPALLGYHVVDEPGSSMMLDFMQGKEAFEKDNDRVPGLACANCIDTVRILAPRVPLLMIDIYPMWNSKIEPGCWAVPESVKYAKKWGAHNVWILPQAFGGSSWRSPTVPEFTIQFFGGLAYGATGFIPYADAQGPNWLNPDKNIPLSESGNLFDPFGNETELLNAMNKIAPLFRSSGPLFVGAEPLPDFELLSSNSKTFQCTTGKEYDCVGRVLRISQNRQFRLLVVWGNDIAQAHSTTLSLKSFGQNEILMDLYSFRTCGNSLELTLAPGDGRIFAVADKATLDGIQRDVLKRRIAIHDEILQLEIAESRTLPFDASFLQPLLRRRDVLLQDGKLSEAEKLTLEAKALLYDRMHKDAVIGPVLNDIEETQASLARSNKILTKWRFPADEARLQAIADFRNAARRYMKLRIYARTKGLHHLADGFSSAKHDILTQEKALQQFK